MQLLGTDVDGEDLPRAVLQGIIGKAAGTTTDVQHHLVRKAQLQGIGYAGQLQPGPTDVALFVGYRYLVGFADEMAGLGNHRTVDTHFSKPDYRFGLRARWRQAKLVHTGIKPPLHRL